MNDLAPTTNSTVRPRCVKRAPKLSLGKSYEKACITVADVFENMLPDDISTPHTLCVCTDACVCVFTDRHTDMRTDHYTNSIQ